MTSTPSTLAALSRLVVVAAVLVGTAACSEGVGAQESTWPHTTTPVASDGLVWAVGSTVHLADGSVVDTERLAGSYVVAGPGVWFASAEGDELGPDELPLLRLATTEGIEETDAHPQPGSLTSSSDGRWLAFIDRQDDGAGAAEAVVVDLTTGEEVVRTQDGLVPQDSAGADWRDLYEDAPVGVLGILDDTAYISGLDETLAYDLATGEPTPVDSAAAGYAEPPLWNGDDTWSIPAQEFGKTPVLEAAQGERVTTSVPAPVGPLGSPPVEGPLLEEWALGGWIDETTAVALTPSREGSQESGGPTVLLTCTVPTGACAVVPGTENGVNLPADRTFGLPREFSLAPGS